MLNKIVIYIIIITSLAFIFSCNDNEQRESNKSLSLNHEKEKSVKSLWVKSENGLNMRKDPDLRSEIIIVLPLNEKIELIEEKDEVVNINNVNGKWCKIKYNGKIGWVFGGYLDMKKSSKTEAKEYLITGKGINNVEIGDPYEKMIELIKPDKVTDSLYGHKVLFIDNNAVVCIQDQNYGKDQIIKFIEIYGEKFKTNEGIYPGMALSEVKKILPGMVIKFGPETGEYILLYKYLNVNSRLINVELIISSTPENLAGIYSQFDEYDTTETSEFRDGFHISSIQIYQWN